MGFLELQRQCGVSHEVLRGAQGASHVALGKSGLHAHCEGERVIALESWKCIGPQEPLKKDFQGVSWVTAVNPRFPQLVRWPQGAFQCTSEKSGIPWSWEGPLGTPLGLVQ